MKEVNFSLKKVYFSLKNDVDFFLKEVDHRHSYDLGYSDRLWNFQNWNRFQKVLQVGVLDDMDIPDRSQEDDGCIMIVPRSCR